MSLSAWFPRPAPSVRVEALAPRHAPRLAALHATAFAHPWSVLEFEQLLADRAVAGDGLFRARERDPAGFALSRHAADEAEILTVVLAPALRGKSCARPLLVRHLEELALRGVRSVHLEVEEGNTPALALYRRAGFREVGRRQGYYGRPDGSRATALVMSAVLAGPAAVRKP